MREKLKPIRLRAGPGETLLEAFEMPLCAYSRNHRCDGEQSANGSAQGVCPGLRLAS